MIIGITGQAGTGKDTAAAYLEQSRGFIRIGLADPLKRICKEVFDFSDEQLWGPSENRNGGDSRYLRKVQTCENFEEYARHTDSCFEMQPLSPRYALQTLGTEWGRGCYEDVWIDYGLRTAKKLVQYAESKYQVGYDPKRGIVQERGYPVPRGVVFSDLRFGNEFEAVRKAGGKLVRIVRPGYDGNVGIGGHASEEEQKKYNDTYFDCVILNNGSLLDLAKGLDMMLARFEEA
jgi:hypothetical protein